MHDEGVTVVIPTRDRPRLLAATLASALAQRDVDLTVVVVDDGGRTPAGDVAGGDPRVRVLRHPSSRGVSAARNTGLAAATTRWVAFLDDDDLWAPRKLANQLDALRREPSCRWACSTAAPFYRDGTLVTLQRVPESADVAVALLRTNVVPGGGSGVLAETALLREIGGFDETLSNLADWDCWLRLAQRSPVARVDLPDVGYRRHPASMAHAVQERERELLQVLATHAALYARAGTTVDATKWDGSQNRLAIESGRWRAGIAGSVRQVVAHRAPVALLQPLRYGRRASLRRLEERLAARRDAAAYAHVREWLPPALAAERSDLGALDRSAGADRR